MKWKEATINAITALTLEARRNTFTRKEILDLYLDQIVNSVKSIGATPEQTLSRTLQNLRDEGFIEFTGYGEYRLLNSSHVPKSIDIDEDENIPRRVPTTVSRILRDTEIVAELKRKYAFRCQLCDTRLELHSGFYCEAHHVRPLGSPHHGPDTISNMIIVCPNHHVLLDYVAIELRREVIKTWLHDIDGAFLDYHNALFLNRI